MKNLILTYLGGFMAGAGCGYVIGSIEASRIWKAALIRTFSRTL